MKNEKVMLLVSSIIGFVYIILTFSISLLSNSLIGTNNIMNIINITLYIAGTISSIILLFLSITKQNIDKYLLLLKISSIILFIINIISGILGFIVIGRINKKNMRKLPELEIMHNYKWYVYVIVFVICMAIMFGLSNLFTNNYQLIVSYIFMLTLLIFIFRKDLKRDIKYFKEYFKEYKSVVLKNFLFSLLIMIILTISIKIYTGLDNATNQLVLNEMFKEKPLLIILLAVIYAPIAEELLFRGIFRKILNKKWVFILISGFLFGIAHVIDDFQSLEELLYILVYSSLGCFMADTYYKTNNICTDIMFHFIQNTIAVIGMSILYLFPDMINLIL